MEGDAFKVSIVLSLRTKTKGKIRGSSQKEMILTFQRFFMKQKTGK